MKQQPSRLKFKKYHRFGKSFLNLVEQKVFFPRFGYYFIKVCKAVHLNLKQIEACRKSVRRTMRKTVL